VHVEARHLAVALDPAHYAVLPGEADAG